MSPADRSGRTPQRPRDLLAAIWGAAFLALALPAGWAGLGHHLDAHLLARWGPLALIALGLLLALACLRRH